MFARSSLLLFTAYLIYNFGDVGQVGGIWLLAMSYFMAIAGLHFSRKKIRFSLSLGVLFSLAFILYYGMRIYGDTENLTIVRAEIFGSTSGLLYYFILGIVVNLVLLMIVVRSVNTHGFLFSYQSLLLANPQYSLVFRCNI